MTSFTERVGLALRLLDRRPGLSVARALTVTIVVTAVTAVFTVANATLLRPLPFPEPGRLVRVYFQPPGTDAFADADSLDALAFVRFRENVRTLDALVGIFSMDRGVTGNGDPESVLAGTVSSGFFDVLGGEAVQGRTFTREEFATGAKVVVLGHGFWLRRFGGDPSAVGRVMTVDREPYTIVGVVRAGFEPGFAASEFWTPMDLREPSPWFSGVQTIGRLRPGATAAQAAAELNALLPMVATEAPAAYNGWGMGAIDLREAEYGARRPTILMLLAAVLGLALIAVANLTNLTLTDVISRRGDFALRAALGGGRRDLAAPEILQALILAVAGGGAGLLLSAWLVPLILSQDPSAVFSSGVLTPDWRVALCAFGLSAAVLTSAVVLPVLRLSSPALAGTLTANTRRVSSSRAARRLRLGLVVAQTALGIVLLGSGALIAAAYQRASTIEPGFDPANVLTLRLRLSETALPTPEAADAFVRQVLASVRESPGVVGASTTLNWFVPGQAGAQSLGFVEDRPTPDGAPYRIQSRPVSPGYFEAMGIPIVRGRAFDDRDRAGAQPVAIVSRGFAERFWPGQDPLGRRVKRGVRTREWSTVIGVAGDVRDVSLSEAPRDTLYQSFPQYGASPLPVTLVVRTASDVTGFIESIKRAVWRVDPDQPLANIVTLDRFLHGTLGPQRFRALLVAGYALIGLLLATIGTYGVTARSVVERTSEAGVRMALGGSPSRVWWTIASTSLRALALGAGAGILASGLAGTALGALIPELQESGWRYSALAAAGLMLSGCAAALIASRRVMAIEPSRALQR